MPRSIRSRAAFMYSVSQGSSLCRTRPAAAAGVWPSASCVLQKLYWISMPLVLPLSVSLTNPYRRAHLARMHSSRSCRLFVLSPRMWAPALCRVDEVVPSCLFRSVSLVLCQKRGMPPSRRPDAHASKGATCAFTGGCSLGHSCRTTACRPPPDRPRAFDTTLPGGLGDRRLGVRQQDLWDRAAGHLLGVPEQGLHVRRPLGLELPQGQHEVRVAVHDAVEISFDGFSYRDL